MCAHKVTHCRRQRAQRGFTLVELMVSLVISMLISVAALGSARLFMSAQRQSVGAGTASGNAVTAMASIKHEAEQAALGFYVNGTLPCQTFNLSSGNTTLASNSVLLPINITNSNKDLAQLDVLYADTLEASAPSFLSTPTASNAAGATLASFLPVNAGQAVMFIPLDDAGLPCTIKTAVRSDAPQAGQGSVLYFDAAGIHNQVDFTPVTYSSNSAVSLLGVLNWSRFAVDANQSLVMSRPIQGTSAILARNVVGFQIQYGVTDGVTSGLNSWQYAEGATWGSLTTGLLNRVRALRLGLIIRSPQPEQADAQGKCSATTAQPVLLDRALSLSGNWQCYRYRTSTVIVPIRNILIGSVL